MAIFAFHTKDPNFIGEINYFFAEGRSVRPVLEALPAERKQQIKGDNLICITVHANRGDAEVAAKALYLELLP